jgi:SHAQKYF class myb-like DNA-binding protein
MKHGIWSEDEHDRFLLAIKEFPRGPWSSVAQAVGTRSVRQVQTHTQKYYEKIMRRVRGLRKDRKTWARVEHRIDDDVLTFCQFMKSMGSNKVMVSDPDALRINAKAVSPPSSTNSSPSTSPVTFCLSLDESSSEPEDELDAAPQPLVCSTGTTELPPLEEALDFLIKIMEQ